MTKNKKAKKRNSRKIQYNPEQQQPDKSKTLIWGGVIIAMSSIVLLIFVLSEKVFHLS